MWLRSLAITRLNSTRKLLFFSRYLPMVKRIFVKDRAVLIRLISTKQWN